MNPCVKVYQRFIHTLLSSKDSLVCFQNALDFKDSLNPTSTFLGIEFCLDKDQWSVILDKIEDNLLRSKLLALLSFVPITNTGFALKILLENSFIDERHLEVIDKLVSQCFDSKFLLKYQTRITKRIEHEENENDNSTLTSIAKQLFLISKSVPLAPLASLAPLVINAEKIININQDSDDCDINDEMDDTVEDIMLKKPKQSVPYNAKETKFDRKFIVADSDSDGDNDVSGNDDDEVEEEESEVDSDYCPNDSEKSDSESESNSDDNEDENEDDYDNCDNYKSKKCVCSKTCPKGPLGPNDIIEETNLITKELNSFIDACFTKVTTVVTKQVDIYEIYLWWKASDTVFPNIIIQKDICNLIKSHLNIQVSVRTGYPVFRMGLKPNSTFVKIEKEKK